MEFVDKLTYLFWKLITLLCMYDNGISVGQGLTRPRHQAPSKLCQIV